MSTQKSFVMATVAKLGVILNFNFSISQLRSELMLDVTQKKHKLIS